MTSECAFPNKAKPARVDNACKAALDQVADLLQHDPNSKLVIVGESDAGEKGKDLAAHRALNAKAYLTTGENQKGIDPGRIEVRTGGDGGMRTEMWIVPAGATFNQPGTAAVDETKVKARKGKRSRPVDVPALPEKIAKRVAHGESPYRCVTKK